jgi:hypothetical protein
MHVIGEGAAPEAVPLPVFELVCSFISGFSILETLHIRREEEVDANTSRALQLHKIFDGGNL